MDLPYKIARCVMNRFPLRFLSLVAVLLIGGWMLRPPQRYQLVADESKLWIEGTSTIHDWSCTAQQLNGTFSISLPDSAASSSEPIASIADATVTVPVKQIDCDSGTMNGKMRDALQADAYSIVIYNLNEATVQPLPDSSTAWFQAQTTGQLNITGTTRTIEMTVKGKRLDDGHLRFVGSTPLLMKDFGVDPPTAMFGALKTDNRVVVHFDVVAVPR